MKYDFDTVVDRGGNRSAKYDERMKKFGTDQVIPCGSRTWTSRPPSPSSTPSPPGPRRASGAIPQPPGLLF
ncbi:MAG: hypothetical protein ACLT3D_08345 [Lawsonibacter sp.]